MKTNVAFLPSTPPPFKPVKIELFFESQKELDALGVLFNTNAVMYAVHKSLDVDLPPIYEAFHKAGADISGKIPEFSAALKEYLL